MMPLRFIREKLVQEPEVVDVESVGARMEHHGLKISVDNMFLCDCGDNWECKIISSDFQEDNEKIRSAAPSLRAAVIKALKIAEERQSQGNKGKV